MEVRKLLVSGYAAWMVGGYAALFADELTLKLMVLGLLLGSLIPVWRKRAGSLYAFVLVIAVVSFGVHHMYSQDQVSHIHAAEEEQAEISGVTLSKVEVDGDRAIFVIEARRMNGEALQQAEKLRVTVRLEAKEEQAIARTWHRGTSITLRGTLSRPMSATNIGAFDYRSYLARESIFWILEVKGAADVQVQGRAAGEPSAWLSKLDRMREALNEKVGRLYPPEQQAWMSGILFGYRDELDPEQYRQFSEIGMAHILAISGLHVGLVVAMVFGVLLRMGWTREAAQLGCIAFIPCYIAITGAEPPVVRAGFMAMIGLELMRRKRWKDGLALISGVGWAMLLWHPYYLADVSYQLSFAVTAGLILGVPRLDTLWPQKWPPSIKGLLSVTITAQAVSFPLTLYYFNHIAWASLPGNLILVPLIGMLLLPAGLASLLLSFVWHPLGTWFAHIVSWMNRMLFSAVELLNRWDPYGWNGISPPLWWIVLYYTGLALLIVFLQRSRIRPSPPALIEGRVQQRRYLAGALVTSFLLISLASYIFAPHRYDQAAVVSVIDIGQGDAILVRTPDDRHLLIDTGGTLSFGREGQEWRDRRDPFEVGEDVVVPLLRQRGIQQLDYLILTHADMDHIGGAEAVLKEIPVRRLLMNGTLKRQETAMAVYDMAVDKGIPIQVATAGSVLRIDAHTTLSVYHPQTAEGVSELAEQNEASIVCVLQLYEHRFLFTGDISMTEELDILSQEIAVDVDVLKVAHHGSKHSTHAKWLAAWKPEFAVISAGRNNVYGHPHPTVLRRLVDHGAIIYQTPVHGEVQFRVTPEGLEINQALAP